ncbi:MAG: hypothetical protein NZ524_10385 [Thiobacillaceae bacterium]|nr:hypothetical protein [Thiobacillaceae bacterium]
MMPAAPASPALPLAPKLAVSAYVAVLVPVYAWHYGVQNFLWASDVALFMSLAALWRGSRLLAGTAAVPTLLPELAWNLDFFSRLASGSGLTGLDGTAYMFDPALPLYVRALSLFHVFLPVLLLWLVWRLGYDPRALPAGILLTWAVLLASYLLTDPARNINWVHGLGDPPTGVLPGPLHLLAMLLLYPLCVCLPTHWLLKSLIRARRA